jgi:hypothetical protein
MQDHTSTTDLAEDVAAITFAMMQALPGDPDATISDDNRYDMYGGFPGFTDHAARAALTLHSALTPYHIDNAIELFDRFASKVISSDKIKEQPCLANDLANHAESTRLWALSQGLLAPRSDAAGTTKITHTSWQVSFTLTQRFQTIVTASSEDEAVALGEYLYGLSDTAAFTRSYVEDADWSADSSSGSAN